ncbi:ribosome silencing factor [Caldimonas taiwanensis]|uniref:ribosome silencing factor n=1 Tax=Caldimonas taiwanensis TaxID=307483 RepID=UPI000A0621EE|nr:ribosome silencing factor [Caldimonas taiwanensis]
MDIRKLQRAIVNGLEDVKAQDIVIFNTEHLSPLFERVIVASGTSNRQTKALAASVREEVKKQGFSVISTEGEDNGEWIIVDCGAAVAHIMQPAIRQYYNLEEIWGDKPVRLKLSQTKTLPQARGPEASTPAKSATSAKKTTATAQKATATKKTTAAKTTAAKKPTAVKKAAVVKSTTAVKKTAAAKTTGAAKKTAAAKSAPAKRPAAKKAASRSKA